MIQRLPIALTAVLLGLNLSIPQVQAATATRSSSFTYDPASGLLTKEVIEPRDSNLCLVTEYTYDAFGNKTSVTTRNCNGSTGEAVAPAASSDGVIVPRTTSSTYDAKGQFALSTTNALGHIETRTFDARFGAVATLTGPNGLTTSWTYDTFGRKTLETRADGTTSSWLYALGGSGYAAQSNISYYVQTTQSGITQPSYRYYDTLNRKVLSSRRNMADTDWIDEGNTVYDSNGRVVKTYLPYERLQFASAKFAFASYDMLGRPVSQTTADGSISTMAYAGLTTSATNSLGQTKTTLKNSQGQTVTITDAQGKTISYLYDPFGNLTTTTDALGNVTTLTYDVRGRKIGMKDPDMGSWSYAYNALGELIRQLDAKGQTVTMQYDKLGRMVSRAEPDLNSTWTYDTAVKGIGKLTNASSGNGYSRTHSYDTLGRLSSTSTVIDNAAAPYVTATTYDTTGRVLTQSYPASAGYPTGFAVKNVYNTNGYLTQVVNAVTPTTVYWTANTMDAQGHLTQQTFGNGLITQQVFDPATGRVMQQQAVAGSAVQNMSYTYDKLGNLLTRVDVNNNLTETYAYDSLNRVTNATAMSGAINTTSTFAYDALGNISSKSDAGTYVYGASGLYSIRPHAVASITGTINGIVNPTFTYDANGNMVSGAGRTVTWSSFNIPSQVSNQTAAGIKTVSFLYNPEHERTKELQADGSTVITLSPRYDTGLHFEKKYVAANGVLTGVIEYEHYLYAGGLMFGKFITTTATNGVTLTTTAMEYYSKDHLGSIVAITDGAGIVTQRLSYDVWGKRRYPNGAADPNGLLNNPDMYHGFTGHEMLDSVGLIHMNGRLYDPVMARFVSADPTIQSPGNLQSYNRYSYVWNNPLAATDPSGYLSIFGHKILPGVFNNNNAKIAVVAAAAWFTGGAAYSAYMGSAISAAGGAMAITGAQFASASFTASIIGGATAGFTGGFLASGGDINAGLKGAVYGGIGGAFAGAGTGTFGNMVGSGVNGYLQTGTVQGFARGFAAGGVPQDLGFTDAYLNNGAANLSIGIVRDGIRGGLVSGNSEGVRLGIAYGQVNNAVGHLVGWVSSGFGKPTFMNGAFVYQQKGVFAQGGLTIGNVIGIYDPGADILAHEYAHIPQNALLGASYLPVHALALTTSMVMSGDINGHHSRFNPLECSTSFISVPAPGECR
ncbi:MAG: RHS repeat-associated core domain-containing protein [Gallionella sp.]|jgi:RHS repeat-associated protein